MNSDFKFCAGLVFAAVTFIAVFVYINPAPSQEQIDAQKTKYGCHPTNQFVGKYAERLWQCRNGLMYKDNVFFQWAADEIREKR